MKNVIAFFLVGIMPLMFGCSRDPVLSSGSSVSGNAKVSGILSKKDGTPSIHSIVLLIPSGFDPIANRRGKVIFYETTDTKGQYSFSNIPQDTYSIEAKSSWDGGRLLIENVAVANDSEYVRRGVLQNPGSIKVMLPSGIDTVNGYVYIPGTDISTLLNYQSDFIVLDSVPAGIGVLLCYAAKGSALVPRILAENVIAVSDSIITTVNSAWPYSKKIHFNTTSSGANVNGTVVDFPVLVRLNAADFNFSQALVSGADIRFASRNNVSLPYEIERWDAANSQAEIWVKVDTVFGNNDSQYINLYWGNTFASPASNSAAVFDTGAGFRGVWHLAQPGNAPALDATADHFDGTPSNLSAGSSVSGAIGPALQFDGQSSYITMPGTAQSSLNFPVNGTYCVSAWVAVDSLNEKYRIIASKGNKQFNLQLKNTDEWEFAEFHDMPADSVGWQESTTPAVTGSWVYLVGMRVGTMQYLYANGSCVDSSIVLFPLKASDTLRQRDQSNNFTIGRLPDSPSYYFAGKIDELRVSSNAPSADWIRLCYMNQRMDDKLVTY
jgi:hypothetical protein